MLRERPTPSPISYPMAYPTSGSIDENIRIFVIRKHVRCVGVGGSSGELNSLWIGVKISNLTCSGAEKVSCQWVIRTHVGCHISLFEENCFSRHLKMCLVN